MKTGVKAAAIAALGILLGGAASAATVVIDDFSGKGLVTDPDFMGITNSGQFAAAGAVGGFRDMEINASGGGGSFIDSFLEVANGRLSFNNSTGVTGMGLLTWDGDDDPLSVATQGLGGVDLTGGGTNEVFRLLDADQALTIEILVWDMSGAQSSVAYDAPGGANHIIVRFSDMIGSADLTDVGAVQLRLTGPAALDASFAAFEATEVPVPAALPLFGSSLLMMMLLGRRRRTARA